MINAIASLWYVIRSLFLVYILLLAAISKFIAFDKYISYNTLLYLFSGNQYSTQLNSFDEILLANFGDIYPILTIKYLFLVICFEFLHTLQKCTKFFVRPWMSIETHDFNQRRWAQFKNFLCACFMSRSWSLMSLPKISKSKFWLRSFINTLLIKCGYWALNKWLACFVVFKFAQLHI